jgi:hypothetical protein
MANFKTKLIGLAGAAMMFSGMAFGQPLVNCSSTSMTAAGTLNIRAEGLTELLPVITLTCTTNAAVSGTFNVLVQIPNVPITSKVVSTSTGATEITLAGGTSPVAGVVAGSVVTFSGVALTSMAAGTFPLTISYIRVNASSIVGAGAFPTSVTASAFIQGVTNTTSGNVAGSGLAVAFVFSALTPVSKAFTSVGTANKTFTTTPTSFGSAVTGNYAVCTAFNSSSSSTNGFSFYIGATEGFAGAWKNAADEQGGSPSAVNSGTRIKFVFNNVPTGLNIYVPLTATTLISSTAAAPSPLTAVYTASETGGLSTGLTAATSPSAISGLGLTPLTVTGTTAVAIYEITVDNTTAIDSIVIPVYLGAAANTVTNYLTNPTMTVTTSLAPQLTSATLIPSFNATFAADIVTFNTTKFAPCTTNLLFPFVTNANGFETGIAIANTSKDPFSTTNQSGTCTLNYYQSGVTGTTNPTAVTAPNLAEGTNQPFLAGETYAFTLTQSLAVNASNPATFQGYIIATCNFVDAHAFAYILGGLQPGMFVNPNNTAMGYLALVLSGSATTTYRGGGSVDGTTY